MAALYYEVHLDSGNRRAKTPDEAITIASENVWIGIKDWIRIKTDLVSGKSAVVSYGFTRVDIVPIPNDRK